MFDWSTYTGNVKWLSARTLFLTRHGSHAYGTSLPTSDIDIRGVCIPPKEYYLGLREGFEQAQQKEPDLVIFELRKFCKLALDSNPNALELIFTDPSDHLYVHPMWERMFEVRDAFLSRQAKHTFSGYALAQLKRIDRHYRWLKTPPTHAPARAEFGLAPKPVVPTEQLEAVRASVKKRLDEWGWHGLDYLDPATAQVVQEDFVRRLTAITGWEEDSVERQTWLASCRSLGLDTNFIQILDQERRYEAAAREWDNYQSHVRTRNPARAALEARFGYDTKHAMHLVRLLRMCREILTEGVVRVRRPDAGELLAIRAGAWTYEALVEWARTEDAALTEAMKTSKLPVRPDRARVEKLCVEMIEAFAG